MSFQKGDPFTGVDLDGCRDPKTGEVEPWAKQIIKDLGSYAEVSPSQTGVKIFIKGKLPGGGRKNNQIEMYDQKRFFTVTGWHLEATPRTIEHRGEVIEHLYQTHFGSTQATGIQIPLREYSTGESSDQEVLKRLEIGKSKEKFKRLYYEGDISGYPSPSEADLALCGLLARHTRDASQIDRIFKNSKLYREKWDTRRGEQTYGMKTIMESLNSQGGRTITPQQCITAPELISMDFPELIWAVPRLLPEGVALLCGKPKMGKSFLALNLAVGISQGSKVLGSISVEAGDVLYIGLEDSPRRMHERLVSILKGDPPPERLHFSFNWNRIGQGGIGDLKRQIERIEKLRLIVIDTLAKIHPEGGSNQLYLSDYKAIEGFNSIVKEYHLTILLVHHLRKTGAENPLDKVSGTTGLTGAADTIAILEKGRTRNEGVLSFTGRDIEEQDLALKFDSSRTTWHLVGSANEYRITSERSKILEVLKASKAPMRTGQIAQKIGKKDSAVSNQLKKLLKAGLIEKVEYGEYVYRSDKGDESDES